VLFLTFYRVLTPRRSGRPASANGVATNRALN
jgi:hypothetical protein